MYFLLSALASLAFLALIVGLIAPRVVVRWGQAPTRIQALKYYGLGTVGLLLLAAVVAPDPNKGSTSVSAAKEAPAPAALEPSPSLTKIDSAALVQAHVQIAKAYVDRAQRALGAHELAAAAAHLDSIKAHVSLKTLGSYWTVDLGVLGSAEGEKLELLKREHDFEARGVLTTQGGTLARRIELAA